MIYLADQLPITHGNIGFSVLLRTKAAASRERGRPSAVCPTLVHKMHYYSQKSNGKQLTTMGFATQ